jgi:hypothetical protein
MAGKKLDILDNSGYRSPSPGDSDDNMSVFTDDD